MSGENEISTKLVGFGIPVGALMGILASFFSEVDLSHAFSFGVAGGILTAALMATVIRKESVKISYITLISIGIGFGTAVGIAIGLVTAWSLSESYIAGFSVGALTGIIGGALLGVLISVFNE